MTAAATLKVSIWGQIATGLFLPAENGTWNYFPGGFSRPGYRIDAATRDRLLDTQRRWRRYAMPVVFVSFVAVLLFARILGRGIPGLAPFVHSYLVLVIVWGLAFGLVAAPILLWLGHQKQGLMKQLNLPMVTLPSHEAPLAAAEYRRKTAAVPSRWAKLALVLVILAFPYSIRASLARGTTVDYVELAIESAFMVAVMTMVGLWGWRRLNFWRDRRSC